MAKLKIFRMSGLPVGVEHLEAYKAEFAAGFDAAKDKHGNDMLSLQSDVQELEDALVAKYEKVGVVELPKSAKAWKALMGKFEAPIMVAQSSEGNNEQVLVIVDVPLG